jgi:excisionase family DNA binding protein
MSDLFTAADVARFCGVDLKTIHNWVAKEKLSHFRTEGRHLRFRRLDVIDFLRTWEYPIPDALRAARPHVVLIDGDGTALGAARRALARRFEITACTDVVAGLVAIGRADPDAVVLGSDLDAVDLPRCIARLRAAPATAHVRIVIFALDESRGPALLEAGAAAFVKRTQPARLRETLEQVTGLSR